MKTKILVCVIALCLLQSTYSSGQVVFNAATTGSTASGTTLTFSHTTAGSCRFLIVVVMHQSADAASITSVTYGGVAMTLEADAYGAESPREETAWYDLVCPSAGANNVVITLDAADKINAGATSFSGVDNSSPYSAGVSVDACYGGCNASAGDNVSLSANFMGVDAVDMHSLTPTVGFGQTQRYNVFQNTAYLGFSTLTGTTTTPMYWTFTGTDVYTGHFYGVLQKSNGCGACILPIELLSFTGSCENNNTKLNWKTATEMNNDYFTIERSVDGINFDPIGTVQGAGNSSTIRNYEFADDFLSYPVGEGLGVRYYRLKQTDYNGEYKYYESVSVDPNNCDASTINILPGVFSGYFTIAGKEKADEISVYNLLGQKVYSREEGNLSLPFVIDFTSHSAGVYMIQVKAAEKIINKKLIISR